MIALRHPPHPPTSPTGRGGPLETVPSLWPGQLDTGISPPPGHIPTGTRSTDKAAHPAEPPAAWQGVVPRVTLLEGLQNYVSLQLRLDLGAVIDGRNRRNDCGKMEAAQEPPGNRRVPRMGTYPYSDPQIAVLVALGQPGGTIVVLPCQIQECYPCFRWNSNGERSR